MEIFQTNCLSVICQVFTSELSLTVRVFCVVSERGGSSGNSLYIVGVMEQGRAVSSLRAVQHQGQN